MLLLALAVATVTSPASACTYSVPGWEPVLVETDAVAEVVVLRAEPRPGPCGSTAWDLTLQVERWVSGSGPDTLAARAGPTRHPVGAGDRHVVMLDQDPGWRVLGEPLRHRPIVELSTRPGQASHGPTVSADELAVIATGGRSWHERERATPGLLWLAGRLLWSASKAHQDLGARLFLMAAPSGAHTSGASERLAATVREASDLRAALQAVPRGDAWVRDALIDRLPDLHRSQLEVAAGWLDGEPVAMAAFVALAEDVDQGGQERSAALEALRDHVPVEWAAQFVGDRRVEVAALELLRRRADPAAAVPLATQLRRWAREPRSTLFWYHPAAAFEVLVGLDPDVARGVQDEVLTWWAGAELSPASARALRDVERTTTQTVREVVGEGGVVHVRAEQPRNQPVGIAEIAVLLRKGDPVALHAEVVAALGVVPEAVRVCVRGRCEGPPDLAEPRARDARLVRAWCTLDPPAEQVEAVLILLDGATRASLGCPAG